MVVILTPIVLMVLGIPGLVDVFVNSQRKLWATYSVDSASWVGLDEHCLTPVTVTYATWFEKTVF